MGKNDRRRVRKFRGAKTGSAKSDDDDSGGGGGFLMRMRGGFKEAAGAATGKPKSKTGDIIMWVITVVVAAVAVFVLARRFGLFDTEPASGSTAGPVDLRATTGPAGTGVVGPTANPTAPPPTAPGPTAEPTAPPLTAATAAEATPGPK